MLAEEAREGGAERREFSLGTGLRITWASAQLGDPAIRKLEKEMSLRGKGEGDEGHPTRRAEDGLFEQAPCTLR